MTIEYLLDTNACIAIRDLLNSRLPRTPESQARLAKLKQRWQQVPAHQVAMSVITFGELRYGAEKSGNPTVAKVKVAQLQAHVAVLPCDAAVGEHYGSIRAALESAGQAIGPNDTWIAAHGRATGRTVVTHNTREFDRVTGLSVEDWMA